jgi:DNA-binding transcriptional MerR regulator
MAAVDRGNGGGRRVPRPIDLARQAGVSTQHIRNLEAVGVLPPVARTASGYRQFGPEHLSALMAYQALAAGHGVATARAIMGEVSRGALAAALAIVDASHAELSSQRRMLEETSRALDALAAQSLDGTGTGTGTGTETPVPSAGMRVGELARHLGVRPSALRVWESARLLTPARDKGTGYRRYSASDIRDARIIHLLRQGHYLFGRIRPVLEGLRSTGSASALHAAIAERRAVLDARALAMLGGASRLQRHLETIGLLPTDGFSSASEISSGIRGGGSPRLTAPSTPHPLPHPTIDCCADGVMTFSVGLKPPSRVVTANSMSACSFQARP